MPKPAFQKIDPEKRERIFDVAAEEFAQHGLHGANVQTIAERAGIAKGAVYLYFDNKLDLYCETLRDGARTLHEIFDQAIAESDGLADTLHRYLRAASELIERIPHRLSMYCAIYTSNDPVLANMAFDLEPISVTYWRRILEPARANGEIRTDIPLPMLAYILDSALIFFWTALVTGYQEKRYRLFWGEEHMPDVEDVDQLANWFITFLTSGLQPADAPAVVFDEE